MRSTITLVVLTAILAAPVLADRKAPRPSSGMDVTQMMPARPIIDLGGVPVNNRLNYSGFYGVDDVMIVAMFQPLGYPFIQSLNGIPTRDARQAPVIAQWTFCCLDTRQTYGGVGNYDLDGRVNRMSYQVNITVSLFKNMTVGTGDSPNDYQCGESIAVFAGIGKASAAMNWQVGGRNFVIGQQECSPQRLQSEAMTKAIKNLKLVALTPATSSLLPQY